MASSSSTPNIPASLYIPMFEKLTREKFFASDVLKWCLQFMQTNWKVSLRGMRGHLWKPSRMRRTPESTNSESGLRNLMCAWSTCSDPSGHLSAKGSTGWRRQQLDDRRDVGGHHQDLCFPISVACASPSQPACGKKGVVHCDIFFTMHGHADEMAATNKPLDDDDIVSYIRSDFYEVRGPMYHTRELGSPHHRPIQ
jgi:hypothetical protein